MRTGLSGRRQQRVADLILLCENYWDFRLIPLWEPLLPVLATFPMCLSNCSFKLQALQSRDGMSLFFHVREAQKSGKTTTKNPKTLFHLYWLPVLKTTGQRDGIPNFVLTHKATVSIQISRMLAASSHFPLQLLLGRKRKHRCPAQRAGHVPSIPLWKDSLCWCFLPSPKQCIFLGSLSLKQWTVGMMHWYL